ncbi:hypothetical protein ANN_27633 [Periplaneta americana]|uniref:Uncharacterized protein n=1 Tax=Periplaneta americana TaxID=6978 RepID=A0ABQ8RWF4_PERAM|nr:hypothetical protein ANN_27633 [Periplaneta americana]
MLGGRFLDFHGTWIKTECGDQSYDVISEVKLEETAATRNDAVVKSEAEQDSCNIDAATEEMKLEEMVEDNEVLPDSVLPLLTDKNLSLEPFDETKMSYISLVHQNSKWKESFKDPKLIPDLPRKSAVAMFRLITGHDCLSKHFHHIGVLNSPKCLLCTREEDMEMEHLANCETLRTFVDLPSKYWEARRMMTSFIPATHEHRVPEQLNLIREDHDVTTSYILACKSSSGHDTHHGLLTIEDNSKTQPSSHNLKGSASKSSEIFNINGKSVTKSPAPKFHARNHKHNTSFKCDFLRELGREFQKRIADTVKEEE